MERVERVRVYTQLRAQECIAKDNMVNCNKFIEELPASDVKLVQI